jgi:predicted dehydrogenase
MRIVIIGSGRMGLRHADGLCRVKGVTALSLVDKNPEALSQAKEQLTKYSNQIRIEYKTTEEFHSDLQRTFDVGVVASTAQSRVQDCHILADRGVKFILIEKPLGQSIRDVIALSTFFERYPKIRAYVNLNMRSFGYFTQIRNDLERMSQFQGPKTITVNTGTVGIGANGIHYLDLLFYLLNADTAQILHGEIDQQVIASGRGAQFSDFGGVATIRFSKNNEVAGTVFLSLSSRSTVYGGWDIVGTHGRIVLDEVLGRRTDFIRKVESTMPMNRYAADYLPPTETAIAVPLLSDLSKQWLESVVDEQMLLPKISDSLKAHKLMFDWLSMSGRGDTYPVT